MTMTHYMELLATAQPWNLIIFMAIPVILAETVAITELANLYTRDMSSWVKKLNVWASVAVGFYFTGVFLYLVKEVVIPLTMSGEWRGPADVIAVLSYLSGMVPLLGIALLDLRVLSRHRDDMWRLKWHAIGVGVFLVVAHVAMIFGMLNPELLGYVPQNMELMQM